VYIQSIIDRLLGETSSLPGFSRSASINPIGKSRPKEMIEVQGNWLAGSSRYGNWIITVPI
jgi:hypothetical protein